MKQKVSECRTKCRKSRAVSLLVGDELGPWRVSRVRKHIEKCVSCRQLQADLAGFSAWTKDLEGLQELAPEGFSSVRLAVRARIRGAATTSQERSLRSAWPILAPLAGVVLMAAVLLLGGGRQAPPGTFTGTGENDEKMILMSSLNDASQALLTIQNGPDMIHRVAVSHHGPQFIDARIFETNGDRWIDPTPDPAPGQVIFYRVD